MAGSRLPGDRPSLAQTLVGHGGRAVRTGGADGAAT
jgi:hypothetical protein